MNKDTVSSRRLPRLAKLATAQPPPKCPLSGKSGPRRSAAILLLDIQNFGFAVACLYRVADAFVDERARPRRNTRNGSLVWIGLVFSDDPEGLFSTVVAYDRHCAPELDSTGFRCCAHDVRTGATGAPIAQLASRFGQRFPISDSLGLTVLTSRSFQCRLDQFQPPLCDQVGVV